MIKKVIGQRMKFQMNGEKGCRKQRRGEFLYSRGIQKQMRKEELWSWREPKKKEKDESLMNGMIWSLCPYDSLPLKCPKITLSVSAIILH